MPQNAGFFAHTGLGAASFTSLAATTLNTILDSIVADVGAGGNGWTLWDDQRAAGNWIPAARHRIANSSYISMTNGSTAISGNNTFYSRWWIPGTTQISIDGGVTPYTVSAIASDIAATLGAAWTAGATGLYYGAGLMTEKAIGYIVLKCVGALKTWYVQIIRPKSGANVVRVQCWETWDNAAHTGTGPGPQEEMRAYAARQAITAPALYVLALYPEVFMLWTSGDGGTATPQSDFCYAGALDPVRPTDANAIVFACSNQELSGMAVDGPHSTSAGTFGNAAGGAVILRTVSGSPWPAHPVTGVGQTLAQQVLPRGNFYLTDVTRPLLDDGGGAQLVDLDVYQQPQNLTGPASNEGCRGNVRYLRYPMGSPSGVNLAVYGPDAQGLNHLILRVTYPYNRLPSVALATRDVWACPSSTSDVPESGFAFSPRYPASSPPAFGEIVSASYVAAGVPAYTPRWFAIPINI